MITVTFLRTHVAGQEEIGRITYDSDVLTVDPDVKRLVAPHLAQVDTGDANAVEGFLRDLPRRFDGAYVRARLEE